MKDLLASFCERNSSLIILLFARDVKKRNGITVPFVYLGSADLVNHESERPSKLSGDYDTPYRQRCMRKTAVVDDIVVV